MTVLLEDLRSAFSLWRRRPELVIVELAITIAALAVAAAVPDLDPESDLASAEQYRIIGTGVLLTALVTVPQLAWVGAQRVVYAEGFGHPSSPGLGTAALLRTAVSQTRRFVVLGLFAVVALFPVLSVSASESLDTTGGVLSMLALLAVDVALTFVTPALALTTSSVRVALGVGWRLLRNNWQAAEWHAVLPPAVLTLHVYADLPARVESTVTLLLVPLLVAVRGAVVLLYLRLPHEQVLAEVEAGIAGDGT